MHIALQRCSGRVPLRRASHVDLSWKRLCGRSCMYRKYRLMNSNSWPEGVEVERRTDVAGSVKGSGRTIEPPNVDARGTTVFEQLILRDLHTRHRSCLPAGSGVHLRLPTLHSRQDVGSLIVRYTRTHWVSHRCRASLGVMGADKLIVGSSKAMARGAGGFFSEPRHVVRLEGEAGEHPPSSIFQVRVKLARDVQINLESVQFIEHTSAILSTR